MTTAFGTKQTSDVAPQRSTDPYRLIEKPKASRLTVADLSRMTPDDVDQTFRKGEVGQLPEGEARGTAIFRPGWSLQPKTEPLVYNCFWQGKLFDGRTRTLKNVILPLGIPAISADVYVEASWFDKQPCVVLDYSKRSVLAKYIRDEIRRVAPGLYLGLVYWGKTRLMYFTLEFPV